MSEALGKEIARDRVHPAAVVDVVGELEIFEVACVEGDVAGCAECSGHVRRADGREEARSECW